MTERHGNIQDPTTCTESRGVQHMARGPEAATRPGIYYPARGALLILLKCNGQLPL